VPHAEALEAPFRQLIREVSTPLPHRDTGMRAALDYLAIGATRLLEKERAVEPFRCAHPAVMRAREMLDNHPAQHWSLPDLARFSGLSPSRFSECFARDLGMTPHQYLLRARIEAAKEVLARSDVAITDLAMELGFSSSQHFASTFRRVAGVSARAFRQSALRR
jgi:AraC-like DNA-binding protein